MTGWSTAPWACFAKWIPLPHLRIDRRHRGDALQQGPKIQTGAADEDRQSPLRMHIGDLPQRRRRPFRGRAGQGAVEHAVQPVLRPRALLGGRGCAEHGQVAIDLRAVGIDDHAPDLLSIFQRERGLAAGGRPRN